MALQEFAANTITRPPWAGDYLSRDHLLPGAILIDKAQFLAEDGAYVNVDTAGAAVGDTSIPVLALSDAIPSGSFLNFGTYAPVTAKLNGDAAKGATSLTVDALTAAIPSGTVLRFGVLASVTATVGVAGAAANATSIPVAALSGPIPAGTIMDFGGKKFARLSAAAAAAATALVVDAIPTALVSGDVATFVGGEQFAELTAAAAASATTLTVRPIPLPILDNVEAIFAGGTKQARTTAAAAAAATSITVDELQFALVDGDQASYAGSGTKKKRVPSGTYLGRNFTERNSGTGFGPVATGDDERYLVAFDVPDLDVDASATAVRHNSVVKEDLLPDFAIMSATIKGYLRADYTTQKSAA